MKHYVPLSDKECTRAEDLFERVIVPTMAQEHAEDPDCEDRNGAYLGIRSRNNMERLRTKAGEATDKQFASYSSNIDGKNDALEDNPDHQTSWEVHRGNTDYKPYPGAIRSDYDDRFAISGFSWQRDTIGCLWLAYKLGRIVLKNAYAIAKLCGLTEDFKRLFFKLNMAEKELRLAA